MPSVPINTDKKQLNLEGKNNQDFQLLAPRRTTLSTTQTEGGGNVAGFLQDTMDQALKLEAKYRNAVCQSVASNSMSLVPTTPPTTQIESGSGSDIASFLRNAWDQALKFEARKIVQENNNQQELHPVSLIEEEGMYLYFCTMPGIRLRSMRTVGDRCRGCLALLLLPTMIIVIQGMTPVTPTTSVRGSDIREK